MDFTDQNKLLFYDEMKRFNYLNVTVGITAKAIINNKTAPYVGIPVQYKNMIKNLYSMMLLTLKFRDQKLFYHLYMEPNLRGEWTLQNSEPTTVHLKL